MLSVDIFVYFEIEGVLNTYLKYCTYLSLYCMASAVISQINPTSIPENKLVFSFNGNACYVMARIWKLELSMKWGRGLFEVSWHRLLRQ